MPQDWIRSTSPAANDAEKQPFRVQIDRLSDGEIVESVLLAGGQRHDADDDLDFDLAAAVLELELLREQKRSEVRRLNALIEEKLDQVVRLARIRRDQQLSLPMDEDEASTA
jgi:hypothetical protein